MSGSENDVPQKPRVSHGQPKNGITRAQSEPNPFAAMTLSLTDSNDGPKIRLFRERVGRDQFVAIKFDEQPSSDIVERVQAAGFAWNQQDQVWKKPLDGEAPGVEYRMSQELFLEIANDIRKGSSLEPVFIQRSI